MTRRYEAALLTVEGVAYGEYGETKLNKLLNIYYHLRISGKRSGGGIKPEKEISDNHINLCSGNLYYNEIPTGKETDFIIHKKLSTIQKSTINI